MLVKKRKILSKKEKKLLLEELEQEYGERISSYFEISVPLEEVKTDEGYLLVKNSKVWFFYINEKILPSIYFMRETGFDLPEVIVDIGAIKFITNGADVMFPGIVAFDKEIKKGTKVVIKEEKANTIIGVGVSIIDSKNFSKSKKGKAINLLHHLKDKVWSFKL